MSVPAIGAVAGAQRQRVATALFQRVSSGLHLGLLGYGDKLPSARTLAREFSVDPRVVLAAYRSLADRGVVELRPRSGIYVATPEKTNRPFTGPQSQWLIDVLAESINNGVPAIDFAERVRRSVQTLRLRATVLECNDDQLFSVSDELMRDYGLEVDAVDISSGTEEIGRGAWNADCVVTTVAHAGPARELAARLGVPALVLSMCDDLFSEVRRLLTTGPVYFVVSDVRFAAKLRRFFDDALGNENLRVLVNGRDSIDEIPPDAPAYLTRLTRKTLETAPLLTRVIPEARVFNEQSIRKMLDFVVRSNASAITARSAI